MSGLCCPDCRMRFTASASASLTACPECYLPLTPAAGRASLVGFRLFDPRDISDSVPEALAVSLPTQPDRDGRS
jgi:hypothetical protein